MLVRSGDGRRAGDEHRVGAVVAGQPPQPPQHRCHLGAEDPAVAMRLVDHHVPQAAQQPAEPGVVGQHRAMHHVRIAQDQPRVLAGESSLRLVGITVQGAEPEARQLQLAAGAPLIVRQRLSGRQVEGGVPRRDQPVPGQRTAEFAVDQRRQHGHQVGQRLPGRGGGRQRHVASGEGRLRGRCLVLPRPLDPEPPEGLANGRAHPLREVGGHAGNRGPVMDVAQPLVRGHPLRQRHRPSLPRPTDELSATPTPLPVIPSLLPSSRLSVIPAQAGISDAVGIPAFAGMTKVGAGWSRVTGWREVERGDD